MPRGLALAAAALSRPARASSSASFSSSDDEATGYTIRTDIPPITMRPDNQVPDMSIRVKSAIIRMRYDGDDGFPYYQVTLVGLDKNNAQPHPIPSSDPAFSLTQDPTTRTISVHIDKILRYVSPYELERFETAAFEEARDVEQALLHAEKQELENKKAIALARGPMVSKSAPWLPPIPTRGRGRGHGRGQRGRGRGRGRGRTYRGYGGGDPSVAAMSVEDGQDDVEMGSDSDDATELTEPFPLRTASSPENEDQMTPPTMAASALLRDSALPRQMLESPSKRKAPRIFNTTRAHRGQSPQVIISSPAHKKLRLTLEPPPVDVSGAIYLGEVEPEDDTHLPLMHPHKRGGGIETSPGSPDAPINLDNSDEEGEENLGTANHKLNDTPHQDSVLKVVIVDLSDSDDDAGDQEDAAESKGPVELEELDEAEEVVEVRLERILTHVEIDGVMHYEVLFKGYLKPTWVLEDDIPSNENEYLRYRKEHGLLSEEEDYETAGND